MDYTAGDEDFRPNDIATAISERPVEQTNPSDMPGPFVM
jgi:hypothetical protein